MQSGLQIFHVTRKVKDDYFSYVHSIMAFHIIWGRGPHPIVAIFLRLKKE
jgi:predicted oxidoreductase